MRDLIILGAGGHAREAFWTVGRVGEYRVIGFLDETLPDTTDRHLYGLPVVPTLSHLVTERERPALICAVGDNRLRRRWADTFGTDFAWARLVDPSAIIGLEVHIGDNCIIAPGCILTVDVHLGAHVNLNQGVIVTHDVSIADLCFVGPGSRLAGRARLEEGVSLGSGVIVNPGCTVGAWSVIGAGAVVTTDIPPHCTAVGVPARVIKQSNQPPAGSEPAGG